MSRFECDVSAFAGPLENQGFSDEDVFDLFYQTFLEAAHEVKEKCRSRDIYILFVRNANKLREMDKEEIESRLALARLQE